LRRGVIDPQFSRLLESLRASGFRDLTGARVSATIPVSERLLNELVAASLPRSGAVRDATVRPLGQGRIAVRVKLARPDFLPPITATLSIDRQPELPERPVLAFRVTGLPGLLAMAGPLLPIASMLPPGVRLEGDLLTLDLAALLAARGQRELLGYLDRLVVTSEHGRLVVAVDAKVP
jgi:hypothetical protein